MKGIDRGFARFRKEVEERDLAGPFETVCQSRNVRLEDVYSQSRVKALARARADCWNAMRKRGASYPEIATLWGRDHTTVMSAVKLHQERGEEAAPEEDPREWRFPPEVRQIRRRVADLELTVAKLEAQLSAMRKALST